MHPPAFEWLNVLDWQGELIHWFLLSNCSLMAFELTAATWEWRGERKALLDNSVETSAPFAALVRVVKKLPLLKIY